MAKPSPKPASYVRDDGVVMIEIAPGQFVNADVAKRKMLADLLAQKRDVGEARR